MCSACAPADEQMSTSADPGGPAVSGSRKRRSAPGSIVPRTPMPDATRRETAANREPNRRDVRSVTIGARSPSDVRNRSGKSRMPRTSAPRNA